ncbi:Small heat shock protein [Arcticibacter svalbardensis MN12-7]|uniref:Small heat shock protein n=1 Tax=Arcticibacter svalbardensis MN12-7 TaxID=1150600 RepID=R9GS57_9SPHI|nr:Hsp20/alpha crystallin family protein [Arcticibacter svalbardensis]EOR94556.1 Small heat shock protein [Arcticibacter svalbardensis MN12-7]
MSLIKLTNGNRGNVLAPVFNDLFETVFNDSVLSDRMVSRVPAVNISEQQDKYLIELAAPGLKKEDFSVQLDKKILTITVEQKSEQKEQDKFYNKREFSYQSFVRSFSLPESADDAGIEAKYLDGVLSIYVAKKDEIQNSIKKIEIN